MPEEFIPWDIRSGSMSSFAHDAGARIHAAMQKIGLARLYGAKDPELRHLTDELIRVGRDLGKVHMGYSRFRTSKEAPKDFKRKLSRYRKKVREKHEEINRTIDEIARLGEGKKSKWGPKSSEKFDQGMLLLNEFKEQFPPDQFGRRVVASMMPGNIHKFLKRYTGRDFVDREDNPVEVVYRGKDMGKIDYDPELLGRGVYNLITDAYNHTPGRPVYVTLNQKGRHVEINVTNEGPPLKPEEIEKIGRVRFTRAMHDPKRGYGKISTRLMTEAQGGTFKAGNSRIGPRLTIRLPHQREKKRRTA